jgi:sec-independent protein translocase protein TatA
MGFDNPLHLAFLVLLLLLVFGAKRLPEMGRSLGAGMRGFRDSISGDPSSTSALAAPTAEPTRAVAPAVTPERDGGETVAASDGAVPALR